MPITDPNALLNQAACLSCYAPTPGQQQLLKLAFLQQILLAMNPTATIDPAVLLAEAQCLSCYGSSPGMMQLLELALLQQIVANGSTGGGGGVSSIIAGAGISITPIAGTGNVTITNTGIAGGGFVSGLLTLSQTQWVVPHGLGAVPSNVQVVLRCTSNDAASGWVTGQEADVLEFGDTSDAISNFSVTRDATNITVASVNQPVGNENLILVSGPTGNNPINVSSFNNFRLKIYAKL